MAETIGNVTFIVGLALIVVAVLGGGVEVKEVKIPPLGTVPRALSFAAGCVLVGLVFFYPNLFVQGLKPENKVDLGIAITTHLLTVDDVKRELRHLGKYSGPIDDNATPAYFQAVADFQVSENIPADGLVGAATYGKLREAWPEFFNEKQPGQGPGTQKPGEAVPNPTQASRLPPGTQQPPSSQQQPPPPKQKLGPSFAGVPGISAADQMICDSGVLSKKEYSINASYQKVKSHLSQDEVLYFEQMWKKRQHCTNSACIDGILDEESSKLPPGGP